MGRPGRRHLGLGVVGVFTTFVALSMAEIASTYPTAGGLYYWSSKLGSPAWGWFTGWFNLIGLIGIIGAVGYGLAIYATALFNLLWSYPNDIHHIFYLFVAFMVAATLVNVFDVRITSLINGVSAYWHVIGVLIIVFACIIVPGHHQSAGYVFGQTINNSGFGGHSWGHWPILRGLPDRLDRDGAVHADRLRRIGAPVRGDAQGVARSGGRDDLVGRRLGDRRLHPARRDHVRDPEQGGVQGQFTYITTYIWQNAMGTHWAEVLLFIVVSAQFYCLTACITSGSRMSFAFSRDRAVPGWQLARHVSKHRVPV